MTTVRYYHRTTADAARSIFSDGFRDGEGTYLTGVAHRGVWVSDEPLDANEGATGRILLCVEIDPAKLAEYEWKEADKPYREFCVPASLLNTDGKAALVDEGQVEHLVRHSAAVAALLLADDLLDATQPTEAGRCSSELRRRLMAARREALRIAVLCDPDISE